MPEALRGELAVVREASGQLMAVVNESCTGCEACIPFCPVDCIDMLPRRKPLSQWEPIISDRATPGSAHVPS